MVREGFGFLADDLAMASDGVDGDDVGEGVLEGGGGDELGDYVGKVGL